MKVLFCSKTCPLKGGVERWLAELLPGLQQRGYEVILALAKGHRFHLPNQYLSAYPQLSKIPIRILDGMSGAAQGRRCAIESLIRRAQPDIVVPVMLHEVLGAVSARRRADQAIRVAYPVHEDGIWVFRAIKEYADQIDGVISVSRLCLDALSQFQQWPSDRLFHVRCGAAIPRKARTSRKHDGVLRLGFCGTLREEQKRISDVAILCEELELLNIDYHLRIAGGGEGTQFLLDRLKHQIASERVVLLGWKSDEQLNDEFYPQIDALIVTSDWETGPMVAWEAMTHGVLVVTSQYRGLRREGVFRHLENALIFPVGQPEQAAQMLKDFRDDRERLEVMAENGRRFALHRLGLDHMIDGWASALSSITSLPPKPVRTRPCYGEPMPIRGRLKHWIRHFLRRPYYHGDEHAEWPRYRPGHVSAEEQAQWVAELSRLEDKLKEGERTYGDKGLKVIGRDKLAVRVPPAIQ